MRRDTDGRGSSLSTLCPPDRYNLKLKYGLITRDTYPISCGGFGTWKSRLFRQRARKNEALLPVPRQVKTKVQEIFCSDGRNGGPAHPVAGVAAASSGQ